MHVALCMQLLGEEVTASNRGHLRGRLAADLVLDGTTVLVDAQDAQGRHLLALTGDKYNTDPLSLAVVDRETRKPLPESSWPVGLRFGSPHPVTKKPFCCLRGVAEYYTHPSHLTERWDRDRAGRYLDVVVGHLLDKMGVPA
jgi:hypothetical protein